MSLYARPACRIINVDQIYLSVLYYLVFDSEQTLTCARHAGTAGYSDDSVTLFLFNFWALRKPRKF